LMLSRGLGTVADGSIDLRTDVRNSNSDFLRLVVSVGEKSQVTIPRIRSTCHCHQALTTREFLRRIRLIRSGIGAKKPI